MNQGERIITVSNARRVLLNLESMVRAQKQGLIARQLRQYIPQETVKLATWHSISSESARGRLGAGEGTTLKNLDLELVVVSENSIRIRISTPSWASTIGCIVLIICVLIPYFWPVLIIFAIAYFGNKFVAIPRTLDKVERELGELDR